jgi:hypothetical protein
MKKTRNRTLAGVVLLAAVLLATGIVWAKATKTPIAGTQSLAVSGAPVRYWVDDEGIAHYRGLPSVFVFTSGDLDGIGESVVNVDVDLLTYDGHVSGPGTVDARWGELEGTFEGRLTGTYAAGICDGMAVYHGTSGDFVGMKMMMSFSYALGDPEDPWPTTYQGIILDPHGE